MCSILQGAHRDHTRSTHAANADTLRDEPFHLFEAAAPGDAPRAKARPRPEGRPRQAADPQDAAAVQEFTDLAVPAPPGLKAKPRPAGRERRRAGPALGDLVALKSGGPPMTVIGFGDPQVMRPDAGAEYVWCAWFQTDGYRREALPRAALVPAGHTPAGA